MTLTKNVRGFYEIRVKGNDGKYRRFSLRTGNKEEAMAKIRDGKIKEMELAAQMGVLTNGVFSVMVSNNKFTTVRDALEPWRQQMEYQRLSPSTIANSIMWVNAWMEWGEFSKMPVCQLELEHFDGWINAENSRTKAGTRSAMLTAIRSFCGFCSAKGWMNGNPAKLVKLDMSILLHNQKETLKRPAFTEEEINLLTVATAPGGICEDPFWHAAVVIGRQTGLRLVDICGLEWDCFDFELGTISVWTQKRDRRVALFLDPETIALIHSIPREHQLFLFPSQRETIQSPQYRSNLSVQFSRILRRLNIHGRTFHCLRATYITDCFSKGIPMEHISKAVGHWSTQTTEGYVRPQMQVA